MTTSITSTKPTTVLANNITLTAAAADVASSVWTLTTGHGGIIYVANLNGATGPTVAPVVQAWGSDVGTGTVGSTDWYKIGGPIGFTLGNNVRSTATIKIGKEHPYAALTIGSQTGQNTTFRAVGVEVATYVGT